MQIIPHPLAGGLQQALASIGAGLERRGERQFEQQKKQLKSSALEQAFQKAFVDPNTGQFLEPTEQGVLGFLQTAQKADIPASELTPYVNFLAPQIKQRSKIEGTNDILNQVYGGRNDGSYSPVDTLSQDSDEDIIGNPQAGNLPDEAISRIAAIDPGLARILQDQKNTARQEERDFAKRSFERNKDYLKRLDEFDYNSNRFDIALNQMNQALESGDFESFRNVIGDMTGLEFVKTGSAQVVNSASKEFLISSLGEITGRPNQFLDQQIIKALINPQYTRSANKLILEGLRGIHDLKKKESVIARDIEDKYTSKGKEVPRNFQALVKKQLSKDVEEFEKSYTKKFTDLNKSIPEAKLGTTETVEEMPKAADLPEGAIVENKKTGQKFKVVGGKYRKI